MTDTLLLVDGGHLLAAAGRSCSVGARRVAGRFSLHRLVEGIFDLLPGASAETARLRWYDCLPEQDSPELEELRRDPRVEVVALPYWGGRQRHVEPVIVRDLVHAATAGTPARDVYLLGDPRRHAVAIQTAEELGCRMRLVGVAGGETAPGARVWLRRPELTASLARVAARATPPASPSSPPRVYRPPQARSRPIRVPLPPPPRLSA